MQYIFLVGSDVLSLMSTYTGQDDQEGMRKTNFCPELTWPVYVDIKLNIVHPKSLRMCACGGSV